jgi:putative ABC transport system substrate-binding protein
MRRRDFLAFAILGALLPAVSRAQQPSGKRLRVGWLSPGRRSGQLVLVDQLRKGFRDLGYVEGKNLVIEARFAEGNLERLPALAQELAKLKPDAIVTAFGPTAMAVRKAVSDVPVVFTLVGAPKELGVVDDLARPGGNITGLSSVNIDLAQKRLEVLRDLVPNAKRVGFIYKATNVVDRAKLDQAQKAGAHLSIDVIPIDTGGTRYADAFDRAVKLAVHAVAVTFNPDSFDLRREIVQLAEKARMPAVYEMRAFVDDGGLISYSVNQYAQITRAASYVDKIVRGAKPGDLPVEQPAVIETIVNLRAAKAIGITVPPSVSLRADTLIR